MWTRRVSTLPIRLAGHRRCLSQSAIAVFRDVPPLRQYRRGLLLSGRTVGFVPTMGALHDGHISLIRQAAQENTDVVVSIYVNPTQFGVNEDLDSYPRTWNEDLEKIQALNTEFESKLSTGSGRVTAIFAPTTKVVYPTLPPTSELNGNGSFVTITPLATKLEGASRPVFFRGVATACTKLFNMVTPDRVYFGQKDVQQSIIIKRMVQDFHIDTEVRVGPTLREPDGLAMSSPQSTLAEQELLPAYKRARFEVDYISLADPESLEELDHVDESKGAVLSGAVKMYPLEEPQEGEDCGLGGGKVPVRLIDNTILQPSS
ncbi:pantoate-beta-alanine ligase [Trichophyton equinum CBS 127.97]|uniref:Pantoate--beta-alanine ligase n=1 Tax=Trichophyton equinum (strain ATCC MYA-4606 / CBS 127.97) TaxID=559882 RepID=F2PK75_TRIEC|nr:pantoate-beta-alanine ligase [Trichophyton equinum CBS 127.97]